MRSWSGSVALPHPTGRELVLTAGATEPQDKGVTRSVIVTGASSGIGMAAAKRLARAGHRVVLAARSTHRCEKAAERLRGEGATAHSLHLDLSDPGSIERMVKSAVDLIGDVDTLVSNAGISIPWSSSSSDPSPMRTSFEVNILGAQHLTAQLIPAMVKRGRGDLVFISSEIIGAIPRPRMAAYSASKHALEAWVAVLQSEIEGTGIRASVVRPGATLSNQSSDWDPSDMQTMLEQWHRKGVLTHWGLLKPDDVAAAIVTVVDAPDHVHIRLLEVVPSAPVTPAKPAPEPGTTSNGEQ